MLDSLRDFFADRMPRATELSTGGLRRHTEGFSLETFSLDVSWLEDSARRSRRVVVRLEPYDLEPQFRALEAIADTPVRFPRVLWFEPGPAVLGAPFYVMEWVEGDVPLPILDENDGSPFPYEDERIALGRDFSSILAEIHKVDPHEKKLGFLGMPRDARDAAERAIDLWAGYTERARLAPMPMMTEALVWLRRNLPNDGPVTLVHGDYRTGNFLVHEGRIAAFLDWEMVHLGDPMEDLAWSMSRIWRGESPRAGYLTDPDDLFTWYRAAGGAEIDQERLRFYDVLSGVKMAAIMFTGVKAWHDGRTRDMRMGLFDQQVVGMYAVIANALGLIEA